MTQLTLLPSMSCATTSVALIIALVGGNRTSFNDDQANYEVKKVSELKFPGNVQTACVSRKGDLLLVAGGRWHHKEGGVLISYSLISNEKTISFPKTDGMILACDMSPDSKEIVYGGEDGVILRCDANGKKLSEATLKNLMTGVTSLQYSPDGKYVAAGYGGSESKTKTEIAGPTKTRPGGIVIWDSSLRSKKVDRQFTDSVWSVSFSPDGSLLAYSLGKWDFKNDYYIGGEVAILNLNGTEVGRLTGLSSLASCVRFSPNGQQVAIATGLYDKEKEIWPSGEVLIADVKTSKIIKVLGGHKGSVNRVVWSKEAGLLASGSDIGTMEGGGEIRIWDTTTWKQVGIIENLKEEIYFLRFSNNGTRVIANSSLSHVAIWELLNRP